MSRKRKEQIVVTCPYNREVDCSDCHCERCGWNPDVDAKRKEARKDMSLNVQSQK